MEKNKIFTAISTEDWLLVLTVFISFLVFGLNWFFNNNDLIRKEPVKIHIKSGMNFTQVADTLAKYRLINSRKAFILVGKVLGAERRIQSGHYLLNYGKSNYDYVNDLVRGKNRIVIRVTIPEGLTLEEIATLLSGVFDFTKEDFLRIARDKDLLNHYEVDHNSFEGYLMPDTYEFLETGNPEKVLRVLADEFKRFYDQNIKHYESKLNLTKNQIITLASIIEGETNYIEEMPRIAGVYLNRLRKGMKLQADPTVVYVIGDRQKRLTYNDLQTNSPYNTYLNHHLPPGPINCPGKDALLAAVNPENHKYLYFVASGDGKSHVFAETFSEHKKNVARYRRLFR